MKISLIAYNLPSAPSKLHYHRTAGNAQESLSAEEGHHQGHSFREPAGVRLCVHQNLLAGLSDATAYLPDISRMLSHNELCSLMGSSTPSAVEDSADRPCQHTTRKVHTDFALSN
jgi:hypothetical protein